jgi:tRNA1(Val) A37 N6-methylase TrmN6
LDEEDQRKARGAFFTPTEITHFLTEWAIRTRDDVVLEPSCGEAAFLLPAASRLLGLGAKPAELSRQLHGQDIHPESVERASHSLAAQGFDATLSVGDFFEREPTPCYDAVIGNPPFVRYQAFSGASRTTALKAALRQGVRLNQLASSWAAFAVHASAFLKRDGRLALVLPAELLAVKYAAQIRSFLLRRFANVRLVLFENLVFPGIQEDVVLLLAEGFGGAQRFEVYQARNAVDLRNVVADRWTGFNPRGEENWTGALLPSQAFALYDEALNGGAFETLLDWGETSLGMVTGSNDFFALTHPRVKQLRLPDKELLRISPPGSKHLRGLTFSDHAWNRMASEGERCYLFAASQSPSKAAARYIAEGEALGVHEAYKCSVRDPWWRVPLVERPDLFFTYMNHDRPRLIRNGASVHILNSLYGVRLCAPRLKMGEELLAVASLNSLTLLGAELVGRSYGGGLLKHEPTEADRLPLPSFDAVQSVSSRLRLVQPQIGALLRRKDINPAIDVVDKIILREQMNLPEETVQCIRAARSMLLQRRIARARGRNGKD